MPSPQTMTLPNMLPDYVLLTIPPREPLQNRPDYVHTPRNLRTLPPPYSLPLAFHDAASGSFHATKSSLTSHSLTSLALLNPLRPLSLSNVPLARLAMLPDRLRRPKMPPRLRPLSLLLSLAWPARPYW